MRPRTALLITYTMPDPHAVGVFFRAVRLSTELCRRGWKCFICNVGLIPADPKVDDAPAEIEVFDVPTRRDIPRAVALFRRVAPDVVVFGEYPMPFMVPMLDAARALLSPPIIMLDQQYEAATGYALRGVDHVLLYGVRSLWPERAFRTVPPFIGEVTPRERLTPAGHPRAHLPWITVAGFERRVLEAGAEMLARLEDVPCLAVTVSHSPDEAARVMNGILNVVNLPLQRDPDYFGLIAASRVAVLANGFMQMIEALALACPAVCVHRGLGMDGFTLDPAFRPFVTFDEDAGARVARMREWLQASPFTGKQRAALARERDGAREVADLMENVAAHPRWRPKWQRYADRWKAESHGAA